MDRVTPQSGPPSSERKLATIIFADLVGSTELAASQDPERTRVLLESFYDAMADEIAGAGGTVEKFAGDAVMAAFGAPSAQEDHAERALHAGLSMQRALRELFGDRLALRIGVNTGEVVVGRARERSSFVTGDTVNVAARLEQAAEPNEILVGERTVAAARGAFEFGDVGQVRAKGKEEPVACRRLLRALTLMRPRGLGGLPAAFVGREEELGVLQTGYERVAAQAEPALVTIVGEAGVGKTRLVREFWAWLAALEEAPLRRTGRCLPYGAANAYWPLAEVLKEHLGILESDPPNAVRDRLGDREILGLTLGLDVAGDLHPLAARDRLHEGWIDLLEALTREQPVAMLVEDLHWAEDAVLDLLERLVRDVRGPLLVVATGRPELADHRPGWGGRGNATMLRLEALSEENAEQMLVALVGGDAPAGVKRTVLERAEGNPFFIEELLATLIDWGVFRREDGIWRASELTADLAIPDSVHAVLAARIDLLEPAEKAALQAASVIGRVFWTGPVYELLDGLEPNLRVLEERDFIRRRPGSSIAREREYVIKHALTREVAYASVPKARRARLHAAFAAWLERVGEGRDEHASLLAHHYAEAVRREDADLAWAGAGDELARLEQKAFPWLRRAAELAAGRYEVREALALLERALALTEGRQAKIELLRQTAEVHALNYDSEHLREALEEALALGPEPDVAAAIYGRLAHMGRGRPYMWRQPPAAEVGERWIATALELAAPGTEARGEALLAQALAAPETGAEAAAEVIAIAEAVPSPRLLLYGYEASALVASVAGRFEEACRWVDRALDIADSESDPGWRMHQYWHAGFVYLRGGRLAAVPAVADECERLAAGLTAHDVVHALGLRAVLQSCLGRWRELSELTAAAEDAAAANDKYPCQFNWRSLLVCALGLARVGDERKARRLEERARAGAVVAGPPEREPALLRLALARDDLDEVERILERLPARVYPWTVDNAAARLDALVALGDRKRVEKEAASFLQGESYTRPFALRALGRVRGDRVLIDEALGRFRALGLAWQAEETTALLSAAPSALR
jgi:class 3 adenylate cyclase